MIERQKDSEVGEVDKRGEMTPWLENKELKKERWNEIFEEKREQERETDVTFTNCREW